MLICMCKMLEDLVACSSVSVSTSVAAEKYKDDLVLAEMVGGLCLCLRAAQFPPSLSTQVPALPAP